MNLPSRTWASVLLASIANSPLVHAGVIPPERVVQTGDSTVEGDVVQSLAAEAASINNSGNLAILANVTGNGTGLCGITADFLPGGGFSLAKATFPSPSTSRIYNSPWRLDNGQLGIRDQLSGSPAFSAIRLWTGGSHTILSSTTLDGFGFVTTPSFSKDGGFCSFVALDGSNGLYIQPPGAPPQLAAGLVGGGFRPMTASDGRTVLRINNNADIAVISPSGSIDIVSPVGMVNLGASAGISDDGECVAFLGDIGGIQGIHAVIDGTLHTVATTLSPSTVPNPFQVWRDTSNDRIIQLAELSGGLGPFQTGFSRVAIKEIDRPLGRQLLVTFIATGTEGHTGVYYARLDRASGKVFNTARIARTGAPLDGFTPTSFNLFDPLNIKGQIAFQASDGTRSAVFRHQATTFTKYKQGVEKSSDVIAIAADPATSWHNQLVNPDPKVKKPKTLGQVGCALTSAAIISGIFGKEITPLGMRDLFLALDPVGIDKNNNTYFSRLDLKVGNKHLRKSGVDGGDFQSIVTELLAGRPLMLCVPLKSSIGPAKRNIGTEENPVNVDLPALPNGHLPANSRRHYILAYGLNPDLGPDDIATPEDVYITDPAFTVSYRGKYAEAYAAGEELVDVTLQDYFDINNTSPVYRFSVADWFDRFRFTRKSDNQIIEVLPKDRARQVQRFAIIEDAPPAQPCALIESPVEVRITIGGATYASSPDVAQPGDILAKRIAPDIVAEFDAATEEGVGEEEEENPFPSYLLEFPPAAAGLPADVEIRGIGDGDYIISLGTGVSGMSAANQLTGPITTGQTITGRIEVVEGGTGSLSPLVIDRLDDSRYRLRLSAAEGTYQLEFGSTLDDWGPLGTPVPAASGFAEWTIDITPEGIGFYRARRIDPSP